MSESEKALNDLFMEVCKELRIPELAQWLSGKLYAALAFYWNYKLQQ